jgi:hypothetical protein
MVVSGISEIFFCGNDFGAGNEIGQPAFSPIDYKQRFHGAPDSFMFRARREVALRGGGCA